MTLRNILIPLVALLLSACLAAPSQVTQQPASPAVPTTGSPGVTPTPAVHGTTTPSPAIAEATRAICQHAPLSLLEVPLPLPSVEDLHWTELVTDAGTLFSLEGLTAPVLRVDPSPSGRWWLASLLVEQFVMGGDKALYVLDTIDNRHWVASTKYDSIYSQYVWLDDDRLAWVADGRLIIAAADGQERRTFDFPAPVAEVWAGANDTLLLSGRALWRLFLPNGTSEQVPNVDGVSSLHANLGLSVDGRFAVVNISQELRLVTLARGSRARLLPRIHVSGGVFRAPAPAQVANGPYWYLPIDLPEGFDQPALLDVRDGSLHHLDEFIPGAFYAPVASPDNAWVYAWTSAPNGSGLYVAPSQDLSAGRTIFTGRMGRILWESAPNAIVLISESDPTQAYRFSLPSGEQIPSPYEGGKPLSQMRFLVEPRQTTLGGYLVPANRVRAISPNGETAAILDLPPSTAGGVRLYQVAPFSVLIATTSFDGGLETPCQYKEILWFWKLDT